MSCSRWMHIEGCETDTFSSLCSCLECYIQYPTPYSFTYSICFSLSCNDLPKCFSSTNCFCHHWHLHCIITCMAYRGAANYLFIILPSQAKLSKHCANKTHIKSSWKSEKSDRMVIIQDNQVWIPTLPWSSQSLSVCQTNFAGWWLG